MAEAGIAKRTLVSNRRSESYVPRPDLNGLGVYGKNADKPAVRQNGFTVRFQRHAAFALGKRAGEPRISHG